MFTTRTWATGPEAAPANSVVLSEPLSDTHSGDPGAWSVPGVAARPHALSRSGSVNGATPGMSDTRLTWRNRAAPARSAAYGQLLNVIARHARIAAAMVGYADAESAAI